MLSVTGPLFTSHRKTLIFSQNPWNKKANFFCDMFVCFHDNRVDVAQVIVRPATGAVEWRHKKDDLQLRLPGFTCELCHFQLLFPNHAIKRGIVKSYGVNFLARLLQDPDKRYFLISAVHH